MIHVYCPHFTDFDGTFVFEPIEIDAVADMVRHGYWLDDDNKVCFMHDRAMKLRRPRERFVWRHGWPGVHWMLNKYDDRINIPRYICESHNCYRKPMTVHDTGLLFRGIGRMTDLRSRDLRPEDFEIKLVHRIEDENGC